MNKLKSIISAFLLLAFIGGCTSDFDEMNTNPLKPTAVDAKMLFPTMSKEFYRGGYQVNFNLFSNQYAQYISCIKVGWITDRYGENSGWISNLWNAYYLYVVNNMNEMEKQWGSNANQSDMLNIARIMKVYDAHIITDHFGDIPYFKAGKGDDQLVYDSQKSIYESFFTELADAQTALPGAGSQESLEKNDYMYGGDATKWKRFANTLRLRLALRIAEVDPALAKTEGEAALAAGLFLSNEDNGDMPGNQDNDEFGGFQFYNISFWSEFRMSSTLENMYKNVSSVVDPRMAKCWYGTESSGNTVYKGIDNGMSDAYLGTISANDYSNISTPGATKDAYKFFSPTTETLLMSYAEACFLKAEAAWRGWAGDGDAKTHYEAGIAASFAYFGIEPADYQAYINGGDVPFSSNQDKQFEQIITQKYLALFPNGHEAWSEFRRTGLPTYLKPVAAPEPGGVPAGQFIKKIKYVQNEYDYNKKNVSSTSLNGGQGDGVNVRVWWDTGKMK